jgi:hypothetical protein
MNGAEVLPIGSENSRAVKTWKKKNAEARTEIILCVEASQLAHCHLDTAAEVWSNLRKVHQTKGFASRLAFCRRFWGMTKKPDQIIANWITNICSATFCLKESGVSVDDEDIILVLTMGFSPSYSLFIVSLNAAAANTLLMLLHIINHLLNEETCQTSLANVPASLSDNIALAAVAKTCTPLKQITCFRCGRKGHYQLNCSVPTAANSATTALAFSAITSKNLAISV